MEGLEPLGRLNEIEKITIEGETIRIGAVKLMPNRVMFEQKATLEDGRLAGIYIQRSARANSWNLGDWALAMETKFGEDAAQYISAEHFSEATLKRARWVCEKIEPNRRLKELSFDHHAAVASLDAKDQDRWLARAAAKRLTVQDLRRAMRQKAHKDRYVEQELPQGRYRVIYVDPPWAFGDSGSIPNTNGTEAYGKAERHYPTMEFDKIKELPIREITARDCVLALWVPVPLIPQGVELIAEWGFIYKTEYVWHKVGESGLGQNTAGHYSKLEHEVLMIATRGKMTPDMEIANQFPSVMEFPRGAEHSEKPEYYRDMLDKLWPSVTTSRFDRVELFARHKAKGWAQYGNEQLQDAKEKAANDDTKTEETPVEAKTDDGKKPRLVKKSKSEAAVAEPAAAVH